MCSKNVQITSDCGSWVKRVLRQKLNKTAFLHTIVVDFCAERLQGFGMVSAEILQFYFGEQE
jgi:hypothetical protein